MKKNVGGTFEWISSSLNLDMACLTLTAIQAYDNTLGNMTETKFSYVYNPSSWYPWNFIEPSIPRPLCFYREPRDCWGYYKPGTVGNPSNDFNFSGERSKAIEASSGIAYCAAWSMTSMTLPSGMKLVWDYESNRFDSCNNVLVTLNGGVPRYGGGPRVKKVTLDPSGSSQPTKLSYFYTSDNSFVENNTNSSGHATVQPFPYLEISGEEGNDPRAEKTRGSFYTPTKVAYQKVKVVKNYVPPVNAGEDGQAPLGFTENVYYTSADFPNPGKYGQFDESWRRGFIKSSVQYNASKMVVDESVNHYTWISDATTWTSLNGSLLTGGTVRLKYQTKKRNGVESRLDNYYADEIENPGADRLAEYNCRFYNYTVLPLNSIREPTGDGFSVKGSFIGKDQFKDMVSLIHQSNFTSGMWMHQLNVAFTVDCDDPDNPPPAKSAIVQLFTYVGPGSRFTAGDISDFGIFIKKYNTVPSSMDVYVRFAYLGTFERYKIPNVRVSGNAVLSNAPVEIDTLPSDAVLQPNWLWLRNVHFDIRDNSTEDSDNACIIGYQQSVFRDRDGRPNRTVTTNSNGDTLIKEIIPAFTRNAYSVMLTGNVLAPVCQTTTLGKKKATGTPTVPYVVSAQATTWSKTIGTAAWVPCSSYVWKTDYQADGTPVNTFADFDHTFLPANLNWQYTGSVNKYNANSQPLETATPTSTGNRRYSSAVYGYNGTLPIGTMLNAKWEECGVFTCDYDMNNAGFFDKENLWLHHDEATLLPGAICTVTTTYPHFGQKSLHVKNSKAAARKVAVYSCTSKITRSAWVRPVNTNPIRFAACLVVNGVGNTSIIYDYVYDVAKGLKADGTWQLVNFTIDISKPEGLAPLPTGFDGVGDDGIFMWVGNRPGDAAADFYIDDIRIAPAKARIVTTYYDQLWRQPVLSVDANNYPGRLTKYDSFGRLSHVYKYNKRMGSNEAGATRLLQTKTYHNMGHGLIRPYNPTPTDGSNDGLLGSVTLTWKCEHPTGGTLNYDVYFWTSTATWSKVGNALSTRSYFVSGLLLDQKYYWQVVARDVADGTIIRGPVWSFTRKYITLAEWLADQYRPNMESKAERCDNNSIHFKWRPCIVSPNGLNITYTINYYDGAVEKSSVVSPSCLFPGERDCFATDVEVPVTDSVYGTYTITIRQSDGGTFSDSLEAFGGSFQPFPPRNDCDPDVW